MKKKISLILVIGCLLTTSVASANATPQEEIHDLRFAYKIADIYVDDDAPSTWYDQTHVETIQEGIDKATDGETIFVFNGYYYENVIIQKSIELIGQDNKKTTIVGSVNITSTEDVILSGFKFKNSGEYATSPLIKIKESDSCTISNNFMVCDICNLHITDIYFIDIEDSSNNLIISNNIVSNPFSIFGSRSGIQIYGTSNHNIIKRNAIDVYLWGIWLSQGIDNIVYQNTITGACVGVTLVSAYNLIGTKIVANDFINITGIINAMSKDTLIYYNNFQYKSDEYYFTAEDYGLNIQSYWYSNGEQVGNYWLDYEERYPDATNNGQIWFTPYEIHPDDDNFVIKDKYPLVNPVDIYSIEI